ncbi:MAG: ATP-dependent Clp protease ATP-binding subunit, partial [Bacteroidaceae bacterium]|nr:ATP-dependent Clp protease ATP-binding subunit [Bacteroidaceae bacterium]
DDIDDEDEMFDENDDSFSKNAGQPMFGNGSAPVQKSVKQAKATPTLNKYAVNLSQKAAEGKLDNVIGREKEIERVIQILCRRKKNNPILIGEAGVDKSAIVEGLAQKIASKHIVPQLLDKKIYTLDLSLVVAGTKYRGQFEERMQAIMKEMKQNTDIILFIDEIHTLVGSGAGGGSMDGANILKPALARGEIRCIGATTTKEYKLSIEKDGALERRFQKVMVEPTSIEETIEILNKTKEYYEKHHNVKYTDAAIEACVKLTERYITNRCLPDKAIDALDEAGSRLQIHIDDIPSSIIKKEEELAQVMKMKNNAAEEQNFELAASFRDRGIMLENEIQQEKNRWKESLSKKRMTVDADTIAETVSLMSGIPIQRLAKDESVRIKDMRQTLKSHVIAQDTAIDNLVNAIQRSRVGLKDPNRPIGSFLFIGPTGIGKTYLAKELAKCMFGTEDALIRIDMSEYMDKYNVSRMVGAAPGYVGYEEGGQLTEKVRRHPYSIVLFDEIEKAHPDIFNILLQVMDDGRLTDSEGRTVNFKNTVIIMTSNVGTRKLKDFSHQLGFSFNYGELNKEQADEVIKKAVNKQFSPEFINRIDKIIQFQQLDEAAILKIVDLELSKLHKRIFDMKFALRVSDAAKKFIAKKGYDVQFGARPLRRAIENYIEDDVADLLVNNNLPEWSVIFADYNEGDERLTIKVENEKSKDEQDASAQQTNLN